MEVITKPEFPEDLSVDEQKSLANYISNGCPGLTKIDDVKVFKWFELYMNGKSYSEISQITKDKKDLIVYIAHKSEWHNKRMDYYSDISTNLAGKLQRLKIESANTIATAITAMGKYYNESFNKFLETNNREIMDNLDTKLLAQYYKSLEVLEKIINPSGDDDPGKSPKVNINVGNNATITQKDANTVEVTTDQASGELLRALANYQKSKEKP